MDFVHISTREVERGPDKGTFVIYPDFIIGRSNDLMVRGHSFYAVWDEEAGLWSTDEYDVQRLVDAEMDRYAAELLQKTGVSYKVKHLRFSSNNGWANFRKFIASVSDNKHELDTNLTFANSEVKKADYVSKRLPYSLTPGSISAWDELVGTLYNVDERAKIEWFIGSIVAGDSKKIQKFGVFYGPPASGKSTILNIIQKLFAGYVTTFDAKALGSSQAQFATEVFKGNPLVAIQHDGDLSKIEDNARLNSIVSHEEMPMNEKFKAGYSARVNAILLMGTNQPVRISDAKSGLIRRLIDIHPTGVTIPRKHYDTLMGQVDFELGAIAHHCLETYLHMGKNFYGNYRPEEMMLQTDIFYNFVEASWDVFSEQDGVSLRQAYMMYKEYCDSTGIDRKLPQYKVREELRNYFEEFHDRIQHNGEHLRSYYKGFKGTRFKEPSKNDITFSLVIEETESLFDAEYALQPAQYANEKEWPRRKWEFVKSTLGDLDTSKLHFVKVPEHHIVIDFDLTNDKGEKSLEMNLAAASQWPPTYAELSKGGQGVHLHYNYDGDVHGLAGEFSQGIEVKTLLGDASLRRRLSHCNSVPVATLSGGLPVKEKKVLGVQTMTSEKGLRDLIARNMRKEIHPGTKPSIDFINKILNDAFESGMKYDVTDLYPKLMAFANNSTNQPLQCLKVVAEMKLKGDGEGAEVGVQAEDDRLVFFDVEVYPNMNFIAWKFQDDPVTVRMVNPTPQDVEKLFKFKLVGYNNRRYDNHILWAIFMGYSVEEVYKLSQKIVSGQQGSMFGEAYNISWADVYDFLSEKKSLKVWQVELGIFHSELDFPWDQPVPEDKWPEVEEYCVNDVKSLEDVFNARIADYNARLILAELSGLAVNDTTRMHTSRIIFGNDRRPQSEFVYTDLSEMFPGYKYDFGKSTYRDEDPGEGGYVYAEPGIYENVALLDVASMHPTSIIELNLFGDYTPKFKELLDARLAIKRRDFDTARQMMGGKLEPFLKNTANAKPLSDALKIVINTVYGLTSARFENTFKDPRNKDNIVAKRGALFMIDLKHFVQERGFTVAHIKTDSIKIPNATPEIIEEVTMFGKKYGYDFEHEATYDKFCLVNNAVYVARKDGKWSATGAQFQHPYVFKKLFTHEEPSFNDYCETKQVFKGAIYLDFDAVNKPMFDYKGMHFVGRIGRFVPVTQNSGGGLLIRVMDDKRYAVTGTKGYFWMEADIGESVFKEDQIEIDMDYFETLKEEALAAINKFGSYEDLVS